ncbi:MAG: AI-2E family transporter, partial [Nanoarchaeota archaeon]|nr:AI-2E family transporter [Nanoarchaeota archaeon]
AIIVPLLAILGIVGTQLFGLIQNKELLVNISSAVSDTISGIFPSLGNSIIHDQLVNLGGFTSSLFLNTVVNVGNFLINLSIALFILYYLIIQEDLFFKLKKILPFNEKHAQEIVNNLKNVSYSVVFVSGIIAVVQGSLLALTFLIFGINNAFLWGFVAAVLSFLPIVGPPIVWLPAAAIQFFQGNYKIALGVFISGLIISNIDNFLRPVLGRKISNVHPLTTILGIFIGIMFFGMIGIFVGPLLVSLSVLVLRMFKEEYYR